MTKDKLYTSLFFNRMPNEDSELDKIENKLNSNIAKALLYNFDILNDEYIRNKINQMIEKKIRQMKIGKLFVEGITISQYQTYMLWLQHAFGMEVKRITKSQTILE